MHESSFEILGDKLTCSFFEACFQALRNIESDLRVVIFHELHQDGQHNSDTVLFSNALCHLTECEGNTGLIDYLRVLPGRLDSWENHVADSLSADECQTLLERFDGGVLDLWLIISEQEVEGLDKVIISDVTAKGVSKLSEVSCETESNLPRFVFSGVEQGA